MTVLRQLALKGPLPALTIPMLPRFNIETNPPQTSLIFLPMVVMLAVPLTTRTVCLRLLIIGRTSSKSPLFLPKTSLVPLPIACPWQPLNLVERCRHPLPRLLTAVLVLPNRPLSLLLPARGVVLLAPLALRNRLLVRPLVPNLRLPVALPLPGPTLPLPPPPTNGPNPTLTGCHNAIVL